MDSFTTLPGRYKFDIGLKRTGGGKTGVELNSVEYVGSVDFSSKLIAQTKAAKQSADLANSESNVKSKF